MWARCRKPLKTLLVILGSIYEFGLICLFVITSFQCTLISIPPRLYGVIKAHKPEKSYPMRTIVSTSGTVPYDTSKYLVEIIQPTLNKNIHRVINSYTFLQEAKTWEIYQDEVHISHMR